MINHLTKDQQVELTNTWWERAIKDEHYLIKWLQKLYLTELGGFEDYRQFKADYEMPERTFNIFTNIANDELKHAGLIDDLLTARGYRVDPAIPKSQYWETMNKHIVDLSTAAAVNYFGEAAAAFRFEIIQEHKGTPSDIRAMLDIILPDEQFHRETLYRIAGTPALDSIQEHNDRTLKALLKK